MKSESSKISGGYLFIYLIFIVMVTICDGQEQALIEDSIKLCTLPQNHGLGEGTYLRWYFDSGTGMCTEFKYKGTGGNENNFKTVQDCRSSCPCPKVTVQDNCMVYLMAKNSIGCPIPSKIECKPLKSMNIQRCSEPLDIGPCASYYNRWFYNVTSGQCEKFLFGGCGGNGNNFESHFSCGFLCRNIKTFTTLLDTENESMQTNVPSRCNEERDPGPCTTRISRWYYNSESKLCEEFAYSGCEGNGNNFHTLDMCNSVCRAHEIFHSTTFTIDESAEVESTTTSFQKGLRLISVDQFSTEPTDHFSFSFTDGIIVRVLPQTSETPLTQGTTWTSVSSLSATTNSPTSTTVVSQATTSSPTMVSNTDNGKLLQNDTDNLSLDNDNNNMTSLSPLHVATKNSLPEIFTSLSPLHFSAENELAPNFESTTVKFQPFEPFTEFRFNPKKSFTNKRNWVESPLQTVQEPETTSPTSVEPNRKAEKQKMLSSDSIFFENQLRSISKVLRFSFGTFPQLLTTYESPSHPESTTTSEGSENQTVLAPSASPLRIPEAIRHLSTRSNKFLTPSTTPLLTTEATSVTDSDIQSHESTSVGAYQDICLLPSDRGTCDESHNRYFFNKFRGQCERFEYTGCKGNGNNFETVNQCQFVCRDFIGTLYVKFSPPPDIISH